MPAEPGARRPRRYAGRGDIELDSAAEDPRTACRGRETSRSALSRRRRNARRDESTRCAATGKSFSTRSASNSRETRRLLPTRNRLLLLRVPRRGLLRSCRGNRREAGDQHDGLQRGVSRSPHCNVDSTIGSRSAVVAEAVRPRCRTCDGGPASPGRVRRRLRSCSIWCRPLMPVLMAFSLHFVFWNLCTAIPAGTRRLCRER